MSLFYEVDVNSALLPAPSRLSLCCAYAHFVVRAPARSLLTFNRTSGLLKFERNASPRSSRTPSECRSVITALFREVVQIDECSLKEVQIDGAHGAEPALFRPSRKQARCINWESERTSKVEGEGVGQADRRPGYNTFIAIHQSHILPIEEVHHASLLSIRRS